ncbi:hypothetical protein J6590_060820 [Homalodisca vitripennis]|nr:hypothetical protein J6590_060820 [Homalodisca vitripennis]
MNVFKPGKLSQARSSEIDRLLLRDSESESDNADPNLYSDHDTESEFDLDEVCEAGQHEEESDRKGRSLLQPYMSLRAQQGNLPREIRALAAKFSGSPIPAKENPEPGKRGRCSLCKDSKTKYFCKQCKAWLCLSHAELLCRDCAE